MHWDLLIQLLVKGAVGGVSLAVRKHQENKKLKTWQRECVITNLVQSVTCFQQGLELLTEYLELNDNAPSMNRGYSEWRGFIKEVIKASSMANFTQIPHVCYALRKVIPYLSLIKDKVDPENPAFVRAKEAFKCSSLIASAVFQSTEVRSFNHVFFYSFATAMRVNAAILQYFTSPELLATVVSGHIEQLQFSPIFEKFIRTEKSRTATNLPVTVQCVSQLLILGASLVPLFRPQDKEPFLNKLHTSRTSNLASLIDQYCVIYQTPFGHQGVSDEELDGPTSIAVNSEDLVIVADSRNQKIKAMNATGKFLWQCDPLPEDPGSNVPLAIATNQHDEIFAVFYKESTKVNSIVKFDPNGGFVCSFDTRYCFRDVRQDVIPCGMSISSRGDLYLGDEGNGCIYTLEPDEASLSLRKVMQTSNLGSHFSFCLGPNNDLIVATKTGVIIFHEDGRVLKKMAFNLHKANKVKDWKPLAVTYDADLKHVLIITADELTIAMGCFLSKTVHLKPMMWFVSTESYALVSNVEFPLRDIDNTNGRFDMATGRNGLWCVTEATHRIHCFTMMYHVIKP